MALLSNKEISLALSSLDDWSFSNNKIHKNFSFNTYMDGIAFVNQLAKIAEENNHHPDLTIGWCKVGVTYTSHDQGGVTKECLMMAKFTDEIQ